jgi:hypothetical protein
MERPVWDGCPYTEVSGRDVLSGVVLRENSTTFLENR